MKEQTIDLSGRNLSFIIQKIWEEEAACDQEIVLLTGNTRLELLVDNAQFGNMITALVNHAVDNDLLDRDQLDKLSHKLGFHCQDKEMVESLEGFLPNELAQLPSYRKEQDATSTPC